MAAHYALTEQRQQRCGAHTVVLDDPLFQDVTRDWYALCAHVDCGCAYGAVVGETFFPVSRHWWPIAPSFCSACLAGKFHGSTET
jgi:hypothetical protein